MDFRLLLVFLFSAATRMSLFPLPALSGCTNRRTNDLPLSTCGPSRQGRDHTRFISETPLAPPRVLFPSPFALFCHISAVFGPTTCISLFLGPGVAVSVVFEGDFPSLTNASRCHYCKLFSPSSCLCFPASQRGGGSPSPELPSLSLFYAPSDLRPLKIIPIASHLTFLTFSFPFLPTPFL